MVLVVPLAPAAGGNGLAMRAGMWLDALVERARVHVVVAPVSGPAASLEWTAARAEHVVVVDLERGDAVTGVVGLLADPALRDRLTRTAPLPRLAGRAPPTLAAAAAEALGPGVEGATAVVTLRSYLAPLGITLARRLGALRVVVDLDDDDEQLLREQGDDAEADAYGRLLRTWLPDADAVVAASPFDAAVVDRARGTRPGRDRPERG